MLAETNALFGENEAAAVKSAQGQGDPKLVSAAGQAGGHESSGLMSTGRVAHGSAWSCEFSATLRLRRSARRPISSRPPRARRLALKHR